MTPAYTSLSFTFDRTTIKNARDQEKARRNITSLVIECIRFIYKNQEIKLFITDRLTR